MNTEEQVAEVIEEVESPILCLDNYWNGFGWGFTDWACLGRLSSLFEVEHAEKICFVAKSRADRSTYKVVIGKIEDLLKPVEATLYPPLYKWLRKQISAGRPHIGVRIIK